MKPIYAPTYGLKITGGYDFVHTIVPPDVINASDHPSLEGANTSDPPGDTNPCGPGSAKDGVNAKWDTSRQIQARFVTGATVSEPCEDNKPAYPDNITGNDDFNLNGENNDPYNNGSKLTSRDYPYRQWDNRNGSPNDTIEEDLNFRDFTRLNIGSTWYRISPFTPGERILTLRKELTALGLLHGRIMAVTCFWAMINQMKSKTRLLLMFALMLTSTSGYAVEAILSSSEQEWLKTQAGVYHMDAGDAIAQYVHLLSADDSAALSAAAFFGNHKAFDVRATALGRMIDYRAHHYALERLLSKQNYDGTVVTALLDELTRLNATPEFDPNEAGLVGDKKNIASAVARWLGLGEPDIDFDSPGSVTALIQQFKEKAATMGVGSPY